MLDYEARLKPWMRDVDPAHAASACNLAHYLAMRRFDMRRLQERLAWIGVSSLGRSETHVLANLDKVLGILHRLTGRSWKPHTQDEPAGSQRGPALLEQHAQALFGTGPVERNVRIMVTLPGESAADPALIDNLIQSGMDIARINCAHDTPDVWVAMAKATRKAARAAGRPVRILMDLAGPKLRTGPIAAEVAALKLKPGRDAFGFATKPVRLGLRPAGSLQQVDGASVHLGVDAKWLTQLEAGDRIDLIDARLARRRLTVLEQFGAGVLAECGRTIYLTEATRLRLHGRGHGANDTALTDLPESEGRIRLQRGETLRLVANGLGRGAKRSSTGKPAAVATIACTLPQVFDQLHKGRHIWFDDGRIGGLIRRVTANSVEVEITAARDGGESLGADKGINLPDTDVDLPALTAKDVVDLEVAAQHADIVGLSFAQSADDVHALRTHLRRLGAGDLGLMLKIETRRGFEQLPQILFAAMGCRAAGVMIARGDLAVECGFERMAEIQEEILWACEAAHMPVVWATQVLESLAKTGLPSRAEITDAAMGVRAECVMLNKGPHILDAVRALDDILRRMQTHQSKKRSLLRALKAWAPPKSGKEARLQVRTPKKAKAKHPRDGF
jgi:pyruvate kinase